MTEEKARIKKQNSKKGSENMFMPKTLKEFCGLGEKFSARRVFNKIGPTLTNQSTHAFERCAASGPFWPSDHCFANSNLPPSVHIPMFKHFKILRLNSHTMDQMDGDDKPSTLIFVQ